MTMIVRYECVRCLRPHELPPGGLLSSPCCYDRLRPIPAKREAIRNGQNPHTVGILAIVTLAVMLLVVAMLRCH